MGHFLFVDPLFRVKEEGVAWSLVLEGHPWAMGHIGHLKWEIQEKKGKKRKIQILLFYEVI